MFCKINEHTTLRKDGDTGKYLCNKSSKRSAINDNIRTTKSKIFQPLSKYVLLIANSFNTASAVKNVVKTCYKNDTLE